MRTTITLDPDVVDLLGRVTADGRLSFKQAVNDALRRGLAPARPLADRYVAPVLDLGVPTVSLTKALALAASIEDDAIVAKMHLGK
jgi:hypothetical protein